MWSTEFEPKLITVLREGYSRQLFVRDALAGVVVGVVALPLAIAFAVASGVRPEQGIFTAIIAGFLISALGGSRVQIGGPTGAYVVLIYGVVEQFGYDGLVVATLMAGVLLIAMGLARLGAVIRFIPYPVTVGFTSGIAIIIAVAQVRDALGLTIDRVPADFVEKLVAYAANFGSTNGWALLLCVSTAAVVELWPRLNKRVPGPLVALVATTALVYLAGIPVETIGTRFGTVPRVLPLPRLPQTDWATLTQLISPAIAIALLGGIESLLSAVVADGMTGRRHRSNIELIGQGVANIVAPLFGGLPATGAIARTATNVKNGGRTPVAGMVHALTLLLILLVAAPWASLIPMATLAGILLVVAYDMSEWRVFVRLLRGPRSDVMVLLVTFVLTVFVDLSVAIQAGVVLAALLLMRRMAEVTQVRAIRDVLRYGEEDDEPAAGDVRELPEGLDVFEINGTFCFGATQKFSEVLAQTKNRPHVVILRMENVLAIDATGLHALEQAAERFKNDGAVLLLSGVHAQPLYAMQRSGFIDRLGEQHLYEAFLPALEHARAVLSNQPAPQLAAR